MCSQSQKPFYKDKSELILRDYLAIERTKLANERTFLSYIRASLYLLVAGLGLTEIEIFKHLEFIGYLAFIISFSFLAVGVYRFFQVKQRLKMK
ncbi:DUF202 domain-containing protein [Massilibacteroides sp.]|uniref:DUF202 domain-containing protein n=1 Tax=Massilibacteroides sp. TaxID=2034766 RepID=UPI00262820A6|nr:DUF202 domain-containing protein [Massilibacteroides sp.]MDD4514504.1 DUF202 domain-containing protein [Massilibacteroides sp.]